MMNEFKRVESYVRLLKDNVTKDVNESELKEGYLFALNAVISQIEYIKKDTEDFKRLIK